MIDVEELKIHKWLNLVDEEGNVLAKGYVAEMAIWRQVNPMITVGYVRPEGYFTGDTVAEFKLVDPTSRGFHRTKDILGSPDENT